MLLLCRQSCILCQQSGQGWADICVQGFVWLCAVEVVVRTHLNRNALRADALERLEQELQSRVLLHTMDRMTARCKTLLCMISLHHLCTAA